MDPAENNAGGGTATATPPERSGQVNLPNEGQVSSIEPEKPAAMQGWLNTAPKPGTPEGQPGATPATPSPQPVPVPVPVTSLKRGGLLGVMDSVADVLVGKQKPELGQDPAGNMYIKQHTMTHGEQWARIAGEAMRGAAAGLAAGRGQGNMGKAAMAGIQSQQQAADTEKANLRQDVLDNANNQILRMNMAEQSWRASRLQVEASQHDMTFAQGQEDRLTKAGATKLGTVAHPGDLTGVLKANPDLMKDLVKNHALEFVPNYEDGKPAGFTVFKTAQGYRTTVVPSGAEFPTFNSVTGQYDWHKMSEPTTQGELDDYWTAAGTAAQKFKSDQVEANLKAVQATNVQSETTARNAELPGKIAERAANISKVPSEIAKNWADAHAAEAKAVDDATASGQGATGEALVDAIGKGQTPVGRLAYILARKPELIAAVVKKYPDFDGAKIDSYVKAYQDFTSGKSSIQLNAGGTALMHLAQLEKLNTVQSHNPLSPDYSAYMNQATTLATELAKFYGDATIPAIDNIRNSLTAQLPGKRQRAIETQAKSMSKKFDEFRQQWDNAAPSAAYEAQMPRLAPEAEEARAHFDPAFREQLVKQQQKQPPAAPAGGGMITVRLPNGTTGQIPSANLDKFKQDNPGAQVVQ